MPVAPAQFPAFENDSHAVHDRLQPREQLLVLEHRAFAGERPLLSARTSSLERLHGAETVKAISVLRLGQRQRTVGAGWEVAPILAIELDEPVAVTSF